LSNSNEINHYTYSKSVFPVRNSQKYTESNICRRIECSKGNKRTPTIKGIKEGWMQLIRERGLNAD
jgi:hypothetical protein